MAVSSDGLVQVLDFMRILYDCGVEVDVEPAGLIRELANAGVHGIDEADVDLFLTMGFVTRLLLRHSTLDTDSLFATTRLELLTLGQSLENEVGDNSAG
jgi:hypothetical protein